MASGPGGLLPCIERRLGGSSALAMTVKHYKTVTGGTRHTPPVWRALITALLLTQTWRGGGANPIASTAAEYESTLRTAECGGHAEVLITVEDRVQLSTQYLLGADNTLPPGCKVSWRVAVQANGLENFGLQVTGVVELEDHDNDPQCGSSGVEVTDQDDFGDTTAVTKKVCGSQQVSYVTYQDTVTVQLTVASSGAKGRGFFLTFAPVYACGGLISGPVGTATVIQTPRFPQPYPLDLSCLWDIEAPLNSVVRLTCNQFSLAGRRRGACGDFLMVQQEGAIDPYCGRELAGEGNALTIDSNEALLYFRSAGRYNPSPGFVCTVTFLPGQGQ